jgi:large subunit ribosomal protein L31e
MEKKAEEKPEQKEDQELADLAEELKEEETEESLEEEETPAEQPEEEAEAKEAVPVAEVEEEAKPEKEKEKEIVEERIYTVPLGKAWISPPNKRTSRAIRILRSFMIKHMKMESRKEGEAEEEEEPARLIIDNEVNEKMWSRGIERPPRKIRVRAEKDKEGNVTVYLAEGD